MRARKFASEIAGGQGNILSHNISVEDLEKRLVQAGITDTKKFLEKVTTDSQGYEAIACYVCVNFSEI